MADDPIRILLIEDSLTFQSAILGFLDQAFAEELDVLTAKTLQGGIESLDANDKIACI